MAAHDILMAAAGGSGAATDPQFNYVTMLLHGDGTNGAQNNTFLDSSTNNFTITRNGNTTQGSFSPYGTLWSNYFNGTSDYLQLSATPTQLGSGDFTVEAWINPSAVSPTGTVVGLSPYNSGGWALGVGYPGSGQLYWYNGGLVLSYSGISAGTWYHVAVARSGTTSKMFVNGVQVASATDSANYNASSATYVGVDVSGQYFKGYVSNVRVVKGTALYTSSFTPSTTPLTAVSGTSLLTCQSNRFIDNSSNAYAITISGSPSVQRFSPFAPSAAYDTATIGGSGYFDGSGDYLTLPTSSALTLGTGDFTIEGWAYASANSTNNYERAFWFQYNSSNSGSGLAVERYSTSGGAIFTLNYSGGQISGNPVTGSVNAWNYFAVSRVSGTLYFYVNGIRCGTASDTGNYTVGTAPMIGNAYESGTLRTNTWNGYISDFRVIKGTGLYTGTTMTVPTSPLTTVSGTSLLANFTNGAIFDNAMMNDLETVGDTQISTSVVKYGTGSIAFDGAGDYMTFVPGANFALGTGDFTVEGWFYVTNNLNDIYFFDTRNAGQTSNCWGCGYGQGGTSGRLAFFIGAGYVQTSGSVGSLNTWMHIAFVRASGTLTIYLNGSSVASGALTDNASTVSTLGYMGTRYTQTLNFAGYMDDVRITKGYARYTANFTPPAQAFPNN